MKAAGKWAWWNQHSNKSVAFSVDRAKDSDIKGVIVKAGYPSVQEEFLKAGVRVGTEAYVYPLTPGAEGKALANAVAEGADFAVINAEVEWENQPSKRMEHLIASFRVAQPTTELYASVDTRGNRTTLPYQRVLAEHITAWMPMIYPLAFRPLAQAEFVSQAFMDCLDSGQQFNGLPVLPTIQTYNKIGAQAVEEEIHECTMRGLEGYQAYTIGHATDKEWQVFKDIGEVSEEEDMSWLDETIIDYEGKPIEFEVLQGDLTTRKTKLTRKEWMTLTAWKWIIGEHSHTIPPQVIR